MPDLRLLPPPEPRPALTWRDRGWWDAGGVVGFLLILVAMPAYDLIRLLV